MSFFSRLKHGATKFFGRTLPHDVQWFGRQLSTGASKVASGIGKAENVVSNIEKATSNVPVVGQAFHAIHGGLGIAHNLANVGVAGGHAVTALGQGNLHGAIQSGKEAYGGIKGVVNSSKGVATSLAPAVALL